MAAVQEARTRAAFILSPRSTGSAMHTAPRRRGPIQDADGANGATLVRLHGGGIARVSCTLDEVVAWFEQIRETLA
jgi:hypothetical protein